MHAHQSARGLSRRTAVDHVARASCLCACLGLLLVAPTNGAEEQAVLPVWPGAVAGDSGTIGPERLRAPAEAPTKDAKWITNVTKPTVTENSLVMYLALKRANVPAELHAYAQGGHGFGVRQSSLPCSTWTDRCVGWLRSQSLLGTNTHSN